MRKTIILCITGSILIYGLLGAHTRSDILQVHRAAYPPVIDGVMDKIYFTASTERVAVLDQDSTPPEADSYLDYFGEVRLLWDDDFIYIFTKLTDDEISSSSPNSWENDAIEYYFDGDNSKSEAFDGIDDIQIRIEFQDGADATLYDSAPVGTTGDVVEWENPSGEAHGYTIEVAFPLAELMIDADIGTPFGFEIQVNERDNEIRENMFRWWGNSNDAWHWPYLWGTAELTDYVADDVMNVMPAPAAPIIDGELDDVWIENAPEISMGTYVFTNYDQIGSDYTEITDWRDAQFAFRTLWDQNNFYLWCEVIDDELNNDSPNSWENDAIELDFDGNNDKTDNLDGNDRAWTWIWDSDVNDLLIGNESFAWGYPDSNLEGYTFELMIPASSLPFPLEPDTDIGFEIQIDDRENGIRENILHWWGSDNGHWNQPFRFGTIRLSEAFTSVTIFPPIVWTHAVDDVSSHSAVLKGQVNPNGAVTTVRFQYGMDTNYGMETEAAQNPLYDSSVTAVTAELTGLTPNTTYHFRTAGTNVAGTSYGSDLAFTTLPLAPTVITDQASDVTTVSAVLKGSVDPGGTETTVTFQYGTNTSYGQGVPAIQSPVTDSSPVPVSAGISGLIPGTDYHFCVTATSRGGTTQGADQTFRTLANNPLAPSITHSPEIITTSVQSAAIEASISDEDGIASATLFYRMAGKIAYSSTPMSRIRENIFEGTIPSNAVTERGFEYYISASDPIGNVSTKPDLNPASSPYAVQTEFSNLNCAYFTPANSYRMISVPAHLYSSSPVSVLEDDFGSYNRTEWRLLRGQNGVYVEYSIGSIENFTPGRAFWLITREAKSWDAESGKSVSTAGNYSIALSTGWNQIGNPFAFPVAWSDVVKNDAVEALWAYETTGGNASGYVLNPAQLVPWKGYCVYNNAGHATTLEIPPREASGTAKTSTLPILSSQPGDWIVQIMALCGSASDIDNYAGCLQSAVEEWDPNDFREPTPIGEYVSLSFPHDEWESYPGELAGDFRPADGQGHEWTFSVRTHISRSAVHLTFEGFQNLPEGIQTVLIDETAKCSINPAETRDYTFLSGSGDTKRSFRLIAGGNEYVDEFEKSLPIPENCCLYPNSPNPFNASTLISYSIPSESVVSLKVYDMLARLVATLEDDDLKSAGRHSVRWDGKDNQGSEVTSGVYVVRFRVGDKVMQRKMLMIK